MAGTWKDEEVFALIEIWGDDVVQAQLEGCKRNKLVYERISKTMAEMGYERTADQCREKSKKLKMEYRKTKDKHSKTGTGRKQWKFFKMLDTVLGDKPATQPPVLVDTLGESEADSVPDNVLSPASNSLSLPSDQSTSSDPCLAGESSSSTCDDQVCNVLCQAHACCESLVISLLFIS